MKGYCYFCDKEVDAIIDESNAHLDTTYGSVECLIRVAFCPDCDDIISIPEIDDENAKKLNHEKMVVRESNPKYWEDIKRAEENVYGL
jgi:uncharacterized protein YlaI